MTARLTWSEVDARWPGASAHWDSVPGRFDPVLVEGAYGTLYAEDPDCEIATGNIGHGVRCTRMRWERGRWSVC